MDHIKSRQDLFAFYKNYCKGNKIEIMNSNTINPLLKSFIIETFRSPYTNNLSKKSLFELEPDMQNLAQIDDNLYEVESFNKIPNYVERIDDRFWILYTVDKSSNIDNYVNQLIRKSVYLDNLWISGILFNKLWECLSPIFGLHRYIRMSFEYEDIFDTPKNQKSDSNTLSDDTDDIYLSDEKRVSKISFTEQNESIKKVLPELQKLLPSFNSMGSLRIPSSSGKGGHDFYYYGKVTNRSDDFLGYRDQIKYICNKYENLTENIENEVWFGVENDTVKVGGEFQQIKGTPVCIIFKTELPVDKFQNFIYQTFEECSGPFRLWGNPIKINEKTVHVYGLDMHLWQEVYMELSTKGIIVILPQGTCGNTVHRLVTNIQRYLEPKIEVYVGNEKYEDIILSVVEGGSNNGR